MIDKTQCIFFFLLLASLLRTIHLTFALAVLPGSYSNIRTVKDGIRFPSIEVHCEKTSNTSTTVSH